MNVSLVLLWVAPGSNRCSGEGPRGSIRCWLRRGSGLLRRRSGIPGPIVGAVVSPDVVSDLSVPAGDRQARVAWPGGQCRGELGGIQCLGEAFQRCGHGRDIASGARFDGYRSCPGTVVTSGEGMSGGGRPRKGVCGGRQDDEPSEDRTLATRRVWEVNGYRADVVFELKLAMITLRRSNN